MPHWQIQTAPAKLDGVLTGNYTDDDLRFRLHCLGGMLVKAEAAAREAQRALDADLASARRNGQHAIADEAIKDLAERRAR